MADGGRPVNAESKAKNRKKQRQLIAVAVVVIAVAVAAAVVILSSQPTTSGAARDYSTVQQSRQADGGFVLGSDSAPVTIVAFEDFLCGHCQRYKATVDQLIDEYVMKGLARFEYRFTPVVHPAYSPLTGHLTECADSLRAGSFWHAHDVMYEIASARQYSDNSSRLFAEKMDLPYADLLACTADATQVDKDLQLANQLGVTGTPTVFVRYGDGPPQPSPFGKQPSFDQLKTIIESAR